MKPYLKAIPFLFFLMTLSVLLSVESSAGDFFVIAQGRPAKRTVLVSPKSTAVQSGDALVNALSKITDAVSTNPYLVAVEPGIYDLGSGSLTMKPFVHILGAGRDATVITSGANSDTTPPSQATVILSNHTSLVDLTVRNTGGSNTCIAVLAPIGITDALVSDLNASVNGSCENNYAIYATGSIATPTDLVLENVTALAEYASDYNSGVYNTDYSSLLVKGGTFTGRGGQSTSGIYNYKTGANLIAYNFDAIGEEGSIGNVGFLNSTDADAWLYLGSCIARDGGTGLQNYNGSSVYAENILALGEGSTGSYNHGLLNTSDSTTAVLVGGSYQAKGGTFETRGIFAWGTNASVEATGCLITAKDGVENYGVVVQTNADVELTHCTIEGSDNCIYRNSTAGTLTVTHSRLKGGPVFGTVTCVCNTRGTTFGQNTCP